MECREPAEGVIYGSQMIVIENFNEAQKPSRADMSERIRERGAEYGMIRRDGFAMSFPGRATAVVNMTHIENPMDPFGASKTGLEGKDQADRTMKFLRSEFPAAFGEARVRSYGLPGIRQTRWIVGRHHLTMDEVRQGVKFPDQHRAHGLAAGATSQRRRLCLGAVRCRPCALRAAREFDAAGNRQSGGGRALYRWRCDGVVERTRDGAVHRNGRGRCACAGSGGEGKRP